MNLEKLKQVLIENKIFVDDKTKNYVCICPYCGDHPNPRKKGHLYISKNSNIPVGHCWYCNDAWPIPKIIQDLTGNKNLSNEIISKEELEKSYSKAETYNTKKRYIEYKIPKLDVNSFPYKRLYVKRRTGNKIEIENIPRLIFNFSEFFNINNIDIVGKDKDLSDWEFGLLQDQFIGFLGVHNTILYCRSVDDSAKFKFKKIPLQSDSIKYIDYWAIENNQNSNLVVLTEGNFNIIGEYCFDSLNIKENVNIYASGNSFSYSALLKSVCFDKSIYKPDVVILGDQDKLEYTYTKFKKENDHLINSLKVYVNSKGKDFGVLPPKPIQII